MGIPGDWGIFLQRESLHLLLPSARGAFISGLPWTNFLLISLSAFWYKETVWIQSPTLRGKQPVVTSIWKRLFIFQGQGRDRLVSLFVPCEAESSPHLSSHWGCSMRGSLLLQLSTCPNEARKPRLGKNHGNQETLEGSCCLHGHFFHFSAFLHCPKGSEFWKHFIQCLKMLLAYLFI